MEEARQNQGIGVGNKIIKLFSCLEGRKKKLKGVFSAPFMSSFAFSLSDSFKLSSNMPGCQSCSSCSHPASMAVPVPSAGFSGLYKEAGDSAKNAFDGRVAFCCVWNIFLSFSLIFSPSDGFFQLERIQNQFQYRCK